MSTIGAEMGQLQQLGQSFTRESQTVAQLTAAISGQVNNTWWKGPQRIAFVPPGRASLRRRCGGSKQHFSSRAPRSIAATTR